MRARPLTDFLDERRWPEVESFLERHRTHAGERIGLALRRADGTDLLGLVAGSPILTADGGYVGTMLNVSDVTGKSTMDAQLAQRERLEAIGAFAGGGRASGSEAERRCIALDRALPEPPSSVM